MNEKDRSKLFIDRLINHQNKAKEGKFYAIQRIDLLVISVSGAGIYIVFEMIRFFKQAAPQLQVVDLSLIKISGCLFVFAILVNFISQWTGFHANKQEDESTELAITKEKGDEIDEEKLKAIDENAKFYSKSTDALNIVSTISMLFGIIILTIFNLFIF